MTGRVIVVGSINVDLTVTAGRLPGPGETVTGGRFERHHGGKGGNQAVAAARVGGQTAFVGAVGDDAFAPEARAALAAEGVDVAELLTLAGEATGVALIVVGPSGENLIAVASGANLALTEAHVSAALGRLAPGPADVVLAGHEIATPAARATLRLGRAAGARTIFNPAPAEGVDRATFGLADILTPNRHELATLVGAEARRTGRPASGEETVHAARTLIEPNAEGDGARCVVVTLGAAGALLVDQEGRVAEVAAPRMAALDTVGAGDVFNGVLAASLAAGLTIDEAARRGVVAASLSTLAAGARSGPRQGELDEALATPG